MRQDVRGAVAVPGGGCGLRAQLVRGGGDGGSMLLGKLREDGGGGVAHATRGVLAEAIELAGAREGVGDDEGARAALVLGQVGGGRGEPQRV
ncbi:hypothetical protein FGB62_35g12 [Gracilaria domingensis]|nr:hypothetical protein FGB62_35g12 [Gracilaria domingensis]